MIRDEDGIGLVAIVVKQPVEEAERTLIDYENVVGHAYDQAQAMTAFGQGTSTVVISSFKESFLRSLEPDGLCSAEHLQDDVVVETETANQAAKNINVAETKRSAMRCTDTSPGVSGFRDISSLYIGSGAGGDSSSSTPDRKTGSTFLAEQNRKQDRKIYSTASHRPHDLVRMLYDATKIAKSKYTTTQIFKLDANKSYEFPKALCVVDGEKETYCWGKLQATLGYQIVSRKHQSLKPTAAKQETIDSNDKQSYYIIGSLGQGSTSNVFQALTWDGEHVAIKVYVKRYGDHYESLDDSAFQNVATAAVEREKDHLLLFYPELFEDKVKTAKLFGRPCLVMPFIHPLTRNERFDATTLASMEKVLGEQFLGKNLRYSKDDVRWRHVGNYASKDGPTRIALSKTQWTVSKLARSLRKKLRALSLCPRKRIKRMFECVIYIE